MYWEKNNPLLVKMHALLCVHPLVVTHCEEKRMVLNCTGSENIQPVCPLAHHYLPPLKMHIGLWVKFSLQVSMKTKQRTFTYCYINRFSKIYLYVINSMNSRLILSIFLHYKGNLKTILEKPVIRYTSTFQKCCLDSWSCASMALWPRESEAAAKFLSASLSVGLSVCLCCAPLHNHAHHHTWLEMVLTVSSHVIPVPLSHWGCSCVPQDCSCFFYHPMRHPIYRKIDLSFLSLYQDR